MRSVRVASTSQEVGRTDEAVSSVRQAAEILETKPDPDAGALATAAFYRIHIAAGLAGDAAAREFPSWPEAARREADLAIADLKAAVARGFRRADIVRGDARSSRCLTRDDMKSLLAEMERPPAEPAPAKAEAPAAAARLPSPLDQPGRLEEDRILGELTIGLLAERRPGRPTGLAPAWKRCWTGSRRGGSRARIRPAWSRSRNRSG